MQRTALVLLVAGSCRLTCWCAAQQRAQRKTKKKLHNKIVPLAWLCAQLRTVARAPAELAGCAAVQLQYMLIIQRNPKNILEQLLCACATVPVLGQKQSVTS